jgi:acyl transferase domain-containing protein
MIRVLGCAESEALAHDAVIGGRPFAEWRAICVAALGRVFNHIAYATRPRNRFPDLELRNLLTVPVRHEDARAVWLEAGDSEQHVNETIAHLVLDAHIHQTVADASRDSGSVLCRRRPRLVSSSHVRRAAQSRCGLVRALRLKHTRDWDKAVGQREMYFRNDLKDQFQAQRFLVPDHGLMLCRPDGSHITDIDAAVLDRQTGSLALIQLKWPDIFGLSPREREGRRLNLVKTSEWISRVATWVDRRSARQVAVALGLGDSASDEKPPVIMVIPRCTARFI